MALESRIYIALGNVLIAFYQSIARSPSEVLHWVIDWNFDEERSRIRAGHGPENVSRLRRFAVGILHHFSDGKTSIAQEMAHLNRNIRLVFDYLRMTKNSVGNAKA